MKGWLIIVNNNKPLCPICLSHSRFWVSAPEYIFPEDPNRQVRLFDIYKCNYCGHGFIHPGFKNNEELMKFYDETYGETYDPDVEDESIKLRLKQYAVDVELIKEYVSKEEISVLDIGCSTGQFLINMPSQWKKYGFEISEYYINYIKEHHEEITPYSEISQINDGFFDVITMRGVIEHMFDFIELFSLLNQKLKKQGQIFICATPDFNSPCSTLYQSLWSQISPPYHYHQFTATSIALLFAKHGFGLKNLQYQYLETPYDDFPNDAKKFIENVKNYFEKKELKDTIHAYPGNIMSLLFEKINNDKT